MKSIIIYLVVLQHYDNTDTDKAYKLENKTKDRVNFLNKGNSHLSSPMWTVEELELIEN